VRWLFVIFALTLGGVAHAHKPSDAHLQIAVDGDKLAGSFAVAVRDLDGALDVDADGDGKITWAETTAAAARIATYEHERLAVASDEGECTFTFAGGTLVDFSDGAYWTLPLSGSCPSAPDTLVVTYRLLFDIDAQHRGIVQVTSARASQTIVVRDGKPIDFAIDTGSWWDALGEGVLACTGPASLLFLTCLLLPIARRRRVVPAAAGLFLAFTIASSVTLLLACASVIALPALVIQVASALSVVLVATLNLLRVRSARWDVAFELGLVLGLGLSLARAPDASPLSFALGVVVGQALVVALLTGVLAAIARLRAYPTIVVIGSALAALAGLTWTVQLCFG